MSRRFPMRRASPVRRGAVALAVVGLLAGCSSDGSAGEPATDATTEYVVNPLEPGRGFVQLGGQRYDFDNVICATGPVESDPDTAIRTFGVYANFTMDGELYAVSMTRYENHPDPSDPDDRAVPTITDTAMIRVQGDGEVLGLKAQRANVIGYEDWSDVYGSDASTELIVQDDDRYDVTGMFGPIDGPSDDDPPIAGSIGARCPEVAAADPTIPAATTSTPDADADAAAPDDSGAPDADAPDGAGAPDGSGTGTDEPAASPPNDGASTTVGAPATGGSSPDDDR